MTSRSVLRRIRVYGSYRNLAPEALTRADVAIVDVLRATSTIVHAVSRGARVLPIAGIDEALARGRTLGKRAVLVGERMGAPLPGFHCNNSTSELAALALDKKIVVLTTTNGTQAVAATRAARRIFAVALTNAPATAGYLCRHGSLERDLAIVCAGRSTGALAVEDLLGAGALIDAVVRASGKRAPWVADGARIALELFTRSRSRLRAALRRSDAAEELIERGGTADVDAAGAHGSLPTAVVLRGDTFVSVG